MGVQVPQEAAFGKSGGTWALDTAKYSVAEVIGSTVGRDEETIRTYIKNQEIADKQLDQLQLKLASS